MIATCIFLFMSGHITTANLIGVTILTLLKHPAQLVLLQKKPELIRQTIAETLRYDCVVQSASRTALVDTVLSGQTIRQGQVVHCLVGAANRDPAKFLKPDQFDITRPITSQLAWGMGIHTCLGRHLGLLVAELAVQKLVTCFPNMVLQINDLMWEEDFSGHGLHSLPVTLH